MTFDLEGYSGKSSIWSSGEGKEMVALCGSGGADEADIQRRPMRGRDFFLNIH
jgi:hypothetical protein